MEELNNNEVRTEVPAEINTWTKIKNFLFQEVTFELTPNKKKYSKKYMTSGIKNLTMIFGSKRLKL